MKFCRITKDGGPDSHVTGFFLLEIKPLISIVFLRFGNGTREAFHSHAFNAVTLWLRGKVEEHVLIRGVSYGYQTYTRRFRIGQLKYTPRGLMHMVESEGTAYALSIRGPWRKTWQEFVGGKFMTLTHGRKVVNE